jgi:hypothetical protein
MEIDLRLRQLPCCTSTLAVEHPPTDALIGVRVSTGCWVAVVLTNALGVQLRVEMDEGALDRSEVMGMAHDELLTETLEAIQRAMAAKPLALRPVTLLAALTNERKEGQRKGVRGVQTAIKAILDI